MNNLLKKSLALLLALLMLVTAVPFLAFADGEEGGDDSGDPGYHQHTFNATPDIPEVKPTCTTDGHGAGKTCTGGCGYVMYTAGNYKALGHDFVLKTTVAATCETGGKTVYECSRCHITEDRDVTSALGHVWTDWKVVKQPTGCNQPGEEQRTCTRPGCGKMEARVVPGPDHQFVDIPKVEATCTTDGKEAGQKCSVCGYTTGCETIKAPGHKYKEKVIAPTCTEKGKTVKTCSVCGDVVESNVTNALGHDLVKQEAVKATCQQEGKTAGEYCKRKGCTYKVAQETIPKTDHDWDIVAAIAPTCTEAGRSEGKKCKTCGKVVSVSEEIPAKGHTFTTEVITPVTCEANGLTKQYCIECNLSETVVVPATGHNLGDWVYGDNFKCEVGGERYKVCANCGGIFEREQLQPQGHEWNSEWTIDTPATCTSKGYKSHHCVRCGKKNDITTIPKAPHTYLEKVSKATTKRDGLITGVCAVCGVERPATTVTRVKSFKLSKTSYYYDGKAKKPTVVVKDANGKKLKKDVDYKVTYASGRKKVGTYVVKVTLIGNYSGSKKLKFKIVLGAPKGLEAKTSSAKQTIKLSWAAVKGAKKYVVYYATEKNGTYKKLGTTAKTAYGIKTFKPGTYYFKVRALTTDNKGNNAYSAYSTALKVTLAK